MSGGLTLSSTDDELVPLPAGFADRFEQDERPACQLYIVSPPRIEEAPIAFECVLHETMETASRYVFFGRVQWLAARAGLVDTQAWRVNLRDFHPVGRFGASFYTRCGFSHPRAARLASPYGTDHTLIARPGDDSPDAPLIYPAAFQGL